MAHEIDVQVEIDLLLSEAVLWREEPAVPRLLVHVGESLAQQCAVAHALRADLDATTVAEGLDGGVLGGVHARTGSGIRRV